MAAFYTPGLKFVNVCGKQHRNAKVVQLRFPNIGHPPKKGQKLMRNDG